MYTIEQHKLSAVTAIFNEQTDPRATEELVSTEICADWNEGQEHQAWIDSASPEEIADWLAAFYAEPPVEQEFPVYYDAQGNEHAEY